MATKVVRNLLSLLIALVPLIGATGCRRSAGTNEGGLSMPRDGEAELAGMLEPIARKFRLPAIAGALVTSNGLKTAAAVGFRKWGNPVPVTVNDLWHLGSDTKAMTAVLAARLVEEGQLRWETRVDEVFPDLASVFHPQARTITVEQLLMHRAGLVPNLNWGRYFGSENDAVRDQRLRAVREALSKPPGHTPGTHFEYSNLGYVVCGAMLERRTDQAWEDLIQKRLFEPLGMGEAGQGGLGTVGSLDQPWGHTASAKPVAANGPAQDNPPVLGPAGRVHASLGSWARFIADQLRGARGASALLKRETYVRLHQPPPGGEYALGWMVVPRDWGGGLVLTHAGCNTKHYAIA